MKHRIRVGLLKAVPKCWDLDGNMALYEHHLRDAREQGVELLITGESFLDGYAPIQKSCTRIRLARVAQDLERGPYLRRMRSLARESRMWQVFGFTQRKGRRIYNAALLVDDRGQIAGVYQKTHLQAQDKIFDPGCSLPVFQTPWGPLGIVICADRRWPETIRCLRVQGARLIANPTFGMCHEANEGWMRTRGYENQCFVCFSHPRMALIAGPGGEVVAKLQSSVPGVLVEDLDLQRAKEDNHLADRRPELYGALVERSAQSKKSRRRAP